ncbi:MAG: BrnT family toxin [Azonexus sp.]|nr:BrnT family toxin [Azonexus sp.]MCK6411920.1 BrnT family toxin [Azonexus sp.]
MKRHLIWDEAKRRSNLAKHGLDFRQADAVLDSRYRLDLHEIRGGELRIQSISYVMGLLTVLTVIHTRRGDATRVISFRRANWQEWRKYDDWLETTRE